MAGSAAGQAALSILLYTVFSVKTRACVSAVYEGGIPHVPGRCYQCHQRHTAANAVRVSQSAWSAHRSVESDAAVCAATALPATHVRARNARTRLASGGRPKGWLALIGARCC